MATLVAELEQIQADLLARIEQAHGHMMEQLRGDVQRLCSRVTEFHVDALDEVQKLPLHDERKAPSSVVTAEFPSKLSEPSIAVCVNGETLHVHRSVLRQVPYFAALLEGDWLDSETPSVNLPCQSDEFGLILKRLYTGVPLGIHRDIQCESALRLAEAAVMLLVDDQLPELADLICESTVSPQHVALVEHAARTLPPHLSNVLPVHNILDGKQALSMVGSAKTPDARTAASAILNSVRAWVNFDELVFELQLVLHEVKTAVDVQWIATLSRDFLDCDRATAVFSAAPITETHQPIQPNIANHEPTEWRTEVASALRSCFVDHVTRCVSLGRAANAVALGSAARPVPSTREHRVPTRSGIGLVDCRVSYHQPLSFCGEDSQLLTAVFRSTQCERSSVAEELARMPPGQLSSLLSDDLVQAAGGAITPVVAQLATDVDAAIAWCTEVRLAALPFSSRKALCACLVSKLDALSPGVLQAVVSCLT
uniref:BTB domain-containing protein n=1 Tax=Noctiluca scintillans TaxID=2966 RepID=A0A7S1A4J6_NOCSC|mmetsp:Transcript_31102/g.82774  ORF Transcript_31102/g.82774 Transcript_31102/m.82774 type:complete len:483 (+) Transcript_31102:33-1481(+)